MGSNWCNAIKSLVIIYEDVWLEWIACERLLFHQQYFIVIWDETIGDHLCENETLNWSCVIKISYNAHVLNHQDNSMDFFFKLKECPFDVVKRFHHVNENIFHVEKYFIHVARLFCINGMNIPKNIHKFMNSSCSHARHLCS
jgi:hypothetical protein